MISLIQTAEGALQETHAILQRMRELAVQSSSDTNMDDVDREAMQKELEALTAEINDIAGRTEFNTQKLIDGSFNNKVFHIGANQGQNIEVTIAAMNAEGIGLEDEIEIKVDKYVVVKADLSGVDAGSDGSGNPITTDVKGANVVYERDNDGKVGSTAIGVKIGDDYYAVSDVEVNSEGALVAKSGADAADIDFEDTVALEYSGVDISSREHADASIQLIDDAINTVSSQRSDLGAIQNRLEHTINNLGASQENLTAAESRIRDTDHTQVAA